jgi:hypothetical protein
MYNMYQDDTPTTKYHPQVKTCNNICLKLTTQHSMAMTGQHMHVQNCTYDGLCQHNNVKYQFIIVLNLVKLGGTWLNLVELG